MQKNAVTHVECAQAAPKSIALGCAIASLLAALSGATLAQTGTQAPARNLQVKPLAPDASVPSKPNQRVALVIGNSAYKEGPLANPVNDARAIAKALQEAGFEVSKLENADKAAMGAALRAFGNQMRAGGTGLFYYAGHGMQIKGSNYLIPVGANIESEDEVAYTAIDAQAVLDKMEAAGNVANIMILDACRNNPFTRSSRGGLQGLAQMDAPVGTLVAYATSPGRVASDGNGANGLYTQHLLSAMRQPGIKAEEVFKQVRGNVRRDSQGKQITWESTSMEGDFYFRGGPTTATPHATEALASTPVPANGGTSRVRYAVGDSWTFATDDLLTNKQRSYTHKVSALGSNGDGIMNEGKQIYSATGAVRYIRDDERERFLARDHAIASQLRVGFKEPADYEILSKFKDGREVTSKGSGTIEVVAHEKIVVPAGTFMAWRMNRLTQGINVAGDAIGGEDTIWFVPEVQRIVAREQVVTQTSNAKQIIRERTVLQSFQLADAKAMAAAHASMELAGRLPGVAAAPIGNPVRPTLPSNKTGFTLGDRWRYQVADKVKGEVVRNYANQVTEIKSDDSLVFNDGAVRLDALGNRRYDRNAQRERNFSPSYVHVPPVLRAGARTELNYEIDKKYSNGKVETEQDTGWLVVKGLESIKTPAGEFNAWRVDAEVQWKVAGAKSTGHWTFIGWYVPQLRAYVAIDEESRNADGSFNRRERHELTSYSVRGVENVAQR
jgi:hypothetical protein